MQYRKMLKYQIEIVEENITGMLEPSLVDSI